MKTNKLVRITLLLFLSLFIYSCKESEPLAPTTTSLNPNLNKKNENATENGVNSESIKTNQLTSKNKKNMTNSSFLCSDPTITYFYSSGTNTGTSTTVTPCTVPYADYFQFTVENLTSWYPNEGEVSVYIDGSLVYHDYCQGNSTTLTNGDGTWYSVGYGVHYFRIVAKSYCIFGTTSESTMQITLDVRQPSLPNAPSLTGVPNSQHPEISWTDLGGGVGYIIYRSVGSADGPYYEIDRTTNTGYIDYSLNTWDNSTEKGFANYKVKAYDVLQECSESPFSNIIQRLINSGIPE